jgi:hypothetical protein
LRSAIRMNFYSLWSIRKTSAARSPMIIRGAMVLPVVTARHNGSIGNTPVFDSLDLEITNYHRYGITHHFGRVGLMSLGTGCVANDVFQVSSERVSAPCSAVA